MLFLKLVLSRPDLLVRLVRCDSVNKQIVYTCLTISKFLGIKKCSKVGFQVIEKNPMPSVDSFFLDFCVCKRSWTRCVHYLLILKENDWFGVFLWNSSWLFSLVSCVDPIRLLFLSCGVACTHFTVKWLIASCGKWIMYQLKNKHSFWNQVEYLKLFSSRIEYL